MNFIKTVFLLLLTFQSYLFSQTLEQFDSIDGWTIFKSDGVDANAELTNGFFGNGVCLEYNFTKSTGYGGIQKVIPLELPENFQFSFYVKAESPDNNFEFKLIDESGHNVWWVNNVNYKFPTKWTKIKIKKRHINFAWGPTEDKSLRQIHKIEFTVASYLGGKGKIYIDELRFEPLPLEDNSPIIPDLSVTSELNENFSIRNIIDNDSSTKWISKDEGRQEIVLSLGSQKEFGGIVIDWDKQNYAKDFNVFLSNNNYDWEKIYSVREANGNKSFIRLKEEDASQIKIELLKSSNNRFSISELMIKNVDYSADLNRFFINIAKDHKRGMFPRYFNEEASFWTITGVNEDVKEALINEDGMVEVDKKKFSIEPFIFTEDKLITWNDVTSEVSLEENYLPVPKVGWNYNDLILETKIFTHGDANKNSVLYLVYKLKNNSGSVQKGKLFLAVRPFQVNPYYQWLNITGGITSISSIKFSNDNLFVDDKLIKTITSPDDFGVSGFDQGDISTYLSKGILPSVKEVVDERNLASGSLSYSYELNSGEEKTIYLAVPFYGEENLPENLSEAIVDKKADEVIAFWRSKLNHIKFNLPESADKIINTIRSNLAYILINKDKDGTQPGSRSYERSWIRDGSLTSSALLKCGIVEEVKKFIKWYSSHQFESGKVPCVVDFRGPDPVPENDSHGQLIYLIKEYFNFTKDTLFLTSMNGHVKSTVAFMQKLISQRSTPEFTRDTLKPYFGLLPESISHEGYSSRPMHSYWDDFFGLKGLKDAAEIQKILGEQKSYIEFAAIRDEVRKNLYNSISLAIKKENIDYLPGCVELGDFDATSTTVALSPCNELKNLPQPFTKNTFEKYYGYFKQRRDGIIDWINYTPYENRLIGSFIFLDQPEKAHELIDFFIKDQKPAGWNHWAEVVWNNDRYPGFIGDMPHTWVGSDFINAIRSLFVYENEYDSSLVIGSALYQDWIDAPSGMSVEKLPTYYGDLSYSIVKNENSYSIKIFGDIKLPSGGIIIKNFNSSRMPVDVNQNGHPVIGFKKDYIKINEFPALIEIKY